MSQHDDRQAVSAYRVRRLLTTLADDQLRDIIATERENGRAFQTLAELAREELARRGTQP
jgi:hypothetical protein